MDTAINKANEQLNFVSQDKDFLRTYHLREMAMSDLTTAVNTGFERGFEKGVEKGIERGFEKGVEKNKFEIAKNMLRMNFTAEQIHEATGLDTKAIRSLI